MQKETRPCRSCERELPEADFYRKPGGGFLSPDCKLCFRDVQKARTKSRTADEVSDDAAAMMAFLTRRVA